MPGVGGRTKVSSLSFGGTAAIVTSLALMVGLDAATATKSTIVSGLLIVALADNLTDALSMHIYQESERRLQAQDAFRATLGNFVTRLLLALTFVLLVWLLPLGSAIVLSAAWGFLLLLALTWALARERKVSFVSEAFKHIAAALAVILVSRGVGVLFAVQPP
jgi:vacuolar iron transporter family protein